VDVDDGGPVVGGADVADIGLLEFLGAQAGQQSREDQREIPLRPFVRRVEPWSCATVSRSASTAVRGRARGRGLASLGLPTSCMGLAASCSPV
jgi:hypothetical protein